VKFPARIGAVLAAGAAIALGAPGTPAHASGFSLNLTPQSEAVVGQPMTIQATGTIPADQTWFPYWFSLDAISTSLTTTCPADRWVGVQFAQDSGSVVVLSQRESPDPSGNFSIPVAVTPSAPGSVLLCGYTDDGETLTLAGASLMLNIKAAPASQPGGGSGPPSSSGPPKSRPPSPPEYARQGIKSCNVLMTGADAKSCVRMIVRKANAKCRKLHHSRRARKSCLRAVRRVSKHTTKAAVPINPKSR
jgi:hypothetical protein